MSKHLIHLVASLKKIPEFSVTAPCCLVWVFKLLRKCWSVVESNFDEYILYALKKSLLVSTDSDDNFVDKDTWSLPFVFGYEGKRAGRKA